MTKGKFITLEGGEGAGKSTQAKNLAAFLRTHGHDVVLTREVGGCPSAEAIRTLWLDAPDGHWDSLTELLLICAARREHLTNVIWPALARGAWVVCDRFVDSTRVYQGIGLGMGVDIIDQFTQHIAPNFEPDMTLLLDLPVDLGMHRVAARRGIDDRYEQKDTEFHQRLRDGYRSLAAHYPKRIHIIDASATADVVSATIENAVKNLLS
jgi:dTMP kinase